MSNRHPGGILQAESLEETLKMVTFDMSKLVLWKNINLYEGYDKHNTFTWAEADTEVAAKFLFAIVAAKIIRDATILGGTIYIDPRMPPND